MSLGSAPPLRAVLCRHVADRPNHRFRCVGKALLFYQASETMVRTCTHGETFDEV